MDRCKFATGASRSFKIETAIFEEISFKKKPFYQSDHRGKPVQYAICPACDNPIQIISLYKRRPDSPKPYGKHVPKSIPGVAEYFQEAYDVCPLADHKKAKNPPPDLRKKNMKGLPTSILEAVRDHFDSVVGILSESVNVRMGEKLVRAMLETYLRGEGFMYYQATLTNIPWVFGLMANSQSLYGQIIKKDSPLQHAIHENCPNSDFKTWQNSDQYVKLSKLTEYLSIEFCFMNHQMPQTSTNSMESIDFAVSQGYGESAKKIYEEKLIIDQAIFLDHIHARPPESERSRRDLWLSNIAKEVFANWSAGKILK